MKPTYPTLSKYPTGAGPIGPVWDDSHSSTEFESSASAAEKVEEEITEETVSEVEEKIKVVTDTIKISGKEAENYKEVLEKIGYSTTLGEFSIDSRGDSPELREELGEDYLDNRVIIVSEDQLRNISSISDMPEYVYQVLSKISADLVKTITPHEALVGNIDLLYNEHSIINVFDPDFKKLSSSRKGSSSLEGLHVSLVLDTLTNSVKKIDSLNNKINFITPDSLKGLDLNVIENILTEIHPLTTKYGSIEHIKNLDTVINFNLQEDIVYFGHKGYEIFLFNNATEPFLVYHGKNKVEEAGFLKTLRSSSKSKIMECLVKGQYLRIPKESLSDKLEDIAKSILEAEVPEYSGQTGFYFHRLFKKNKDKPEITERLKKENWYLLRDVCYGNAEFGRLPLALKKSVTVPKDENVSNYLKLLEEKT